MLSEVTICRGEIQKERELREALRVLMDERDKRYEQRFLASETAVLKSENAQTSYNARTNEFRGQLDDQAKTFMPRPEADSKFSALESKLGVASSNRLLIMIAIAGSIVALIAAFYGKP